jgi:glutaredoxin
VTASPRSLTGLVLLVLAVAGASQWWAGRQQAELGRSLARLAGPGDLLMISSDTCGVCVAARRWLQAHGVRHAECSIERDADCRARFAALNAPGTPVFLVRGQVQLGFDPARLRARLSDG